MKYSWNQNLEHADFSGLVGKTIVGIEGMEKGSLTVEFLCSDGSKYLMAHDQDCCESVDLEDVAGDVDDLLNTPILIADESSSEQSDHDEHDNVHMWTYYKLATAKGYVTLRWYGESNGYYAIGVDFYKFV